MERDKSKKVVISIFLFAIFFMLAIYLGMWITNIYKGTKDYTNRSTDTTVNCIAYMFDVENIVYEDGKLSFLLENERFSDDAMEVIIVKSGDASKEIEVGYLDPGRTKEVSVDMDIGESFSVYPKGCEAYAKTFEG